MTNLTELVEQVARAEYVARCESLPGEHPEWDALEAMTRHNLREWVMPIVSRTVALAEFKKAFLGEWPPGVLESSSRMKLVISAKQHGKTNAAVQAIVDEAHRRGVPITVSVLDSDTSKGNPS